ncbi:TPM domain-containing protein [Noviherbaspirillum cavernae]|uniref:TPM domain-containing protein n=1 Tax=Noviherbaspirillum cavernae TaxID=2320862 RepID=A0A418WYX7_9BURK|nr:TPM domain-containing protein [Noviherbaspirillum cavernae]RJG05303.1 TPM domain-containing protein [Noviherbaspirillum cavernae]
MTTIARLWKHLCTTQAAGRRMFPERTLHAIETAIVEGETRHRAEVRMIVEPFLSVQAVLNGVTPRERARVLFSDYRVWDTEENCGVLVYVNLADHKVEIVADRGVGRIIAAHDWQAICRTMTEGFAHGDSHGSVIAALRQLNALLQQHYPDDGSRHNQLPDKPLML